MRVVAEAIQSSKCRMLLRPMPVPLRICILSTTKGGMWTHCVSDLCPSSELVNNEATSRRSSYDVFECRNLRRARWNARILLDALQRLPAGLCKIDCFLLDFYDSGVAVRFQLAKDTVGYRASLKFRAAYRMLFSGFLLL